MIAFPLIFAACILAVPLMLFVAAAVEIYRRPVSMSGKLRQAKINQMSSCCDSKEENKKLRSVLQELAGWGMGGECNDCDTFREAPSCITYQHHKDCAYLEALNKAFTLLGLPLEEGHDRKDPKGDMARLAQERTNRCIKDGIIKLPYPCKEYLEKLPEHWELIHPNNSNKFCDDGRDYDKPMFMRKDGLARIYFNDGEDNTEYMFAIAWDKYGDGDCTGSFEEAIQICDGYVAEHQKIKDETD